MLPLSVGSDVGKSSIDHLFYLNTNHFFIGPGSFKRVKEIRVFVPNTKNWLFFLDRFPFKILNTICHLSFSSTVLALFFNTLHPPVFNVTFTPSHFDSNFWNERLTLSRIVLVWLFHIDIDLNVRLAVKKRWFVRVIWFCVCVCGWNVNGGFYAIEFFFWAVITIQKLIQIHDRIVMVRQKVEWRSTQTPKPSFLFRFPSSFIWLFGIIYQWLLICEIYTCIRYGFG